LEGAVAAHNHSLLALDEISQASPHEVGRMVYSLGNEVGRTRMSRDTSPRPVTRWKASVLSNGERTIAECIAEAGQQPKAGQTLRILDVAADGRAHGCWGELHGLPSGAALTERLKAECRTHYGRAGRAFLAALTADTSDHAAALADALVRPEFQTDDGQAARAARRFAVIGLAGETATRYGVTGWPAGTAMQAAAECFRRWLDRRGGSGSVERRQVLDAVRDYLDRHGEARFSQNGADGPPVRDRAGWWRVSEHGREYLLTAGAFQEAIRGLGQDRACAHLADAGVLVAGGRERSQSVRCDGMTRRVYVLRAERLVGGADNAF
jgi:putative DNA primase/helicase